MKLKAIIGLIFISLLTGCKSINSEMSDYEGKTQYFKTISDDLQFSAAYSFCKIGIVVRQRRSKGYIFTTGWMDESKRYSVQHLTV